MRRIIVVSAALAAIAAPVAALAAGGSHLRLSAKPHALAFNVKTLRAHHGVVTISMHNPSNADFPHGIAVEGRGIDKDGKIVSPGHTSTIRLRLKPGRYTFYCPVMGHRAAGMRGTLIVR